MTKAVRAGALEKKVYFTQKGLEEAQEELLFLKSTKRAQVTDRIQKAREFGDISENAEYDAALDEQALIENRIAYLEEVLRNAKLITEEPKSDFLVLQSLWRWMGRLMNLL